MKAKRNRFPLIIKSGSFSVKIYRDRKPSGTYFRVAYHILGKRYRLNFADLEKAKAEAEAQANKLSRGDVDAMLLTGKDRLLYGRAVEAVREFNVPLDGVALEYSEARKLLNGAGIVDAARFYSRHHSHGIKSKAVADAVEEMISAKQRDGVSNVYLNDLRYRLRVFARRFQCDLISVVPEDVQGFFDSLTLSPRSFNNFLSILRTFFRFAQERRWLSKETNLLEAVKRRKDKSLPVEILTPGEMTALLEHATPEIACCLALGAFAGLRSEEILRLAWKDVTRRPGFIEVAADKAKTATRRLVPVVGNLALWLSLSPSDEGPVWKDTKAMFFKKRLQVSGAAKVTWKTNALRHSWISYRLAEVQDVNRVALEAGNSAQMIFRHYRELVAPEEAQTWFAIKPSAGRKVVPMQTQAA
jgi:integrase